MDRYESKESHLVEELGSDGPVSKDGRTPIIVGTHDRCRYDGRADGEADQWFVKMDELIKPWQ